MNEGGLSLEKKFKNPEEEIAFLREQVALRERELKVSTETARSEVVRDVVNSYAAVPKPQVIHEEYTSTPEHKESIRLKLSPEAHDSELGQYIFLLQEKGVKVAIDAVARVKDIHLYDDFHRFLVEYLKEGLNLSGLKEKTPLWRELHMTLYEVVLPEPETGKERSLGEVLSSMEQFYAGMNSVGDAEDNNYYTFELAVSNHSDEFIFYFGIPDEKTVLFEKQILAIFPNAKVVTKSDDYNIFNETGVATTATIALAHNHALPIKSYEQFNYDPLNVLTNAFSKIKRSGEGAAIQFLIRPARRDYIKTYKEYITKLEGGASLRELGGSESLGTVFTSVLKEFWTGSKSKETKTDEAKKKVDTQAIDSIRKKMESPLLEVNARIVVSSESVELSNAILDDIESSFNQFELTHGNKVVFKRPQKSRLESSLEDFVYRRFVPDERLVLSQKELATLIHVPATGKLASSQVKLVRSSGAPAPLDLPQEGTLLGTNTYQGIETNVYLTKEDRVRHFYCIGQTGTGKTTLLKNMIVQDIRAGHGVCYIDPHGTDIQDILASIPPERADDVIYFDPAYTERPMALNMLEYDVRYPEQKTFVVNELLGIFNKLFDMKTAGGPMFEQYFRNAVMLVIEHPESGSTLLDVSRVLASKEFRKLKLDNCKNPIVTQFWREVAEKAGGEASLQNIVPYITSKFDNFLSNEIMRPIIAQEKSAFNFREVMDGKKILLVNLSKGRLGDLNANLIGLIVVGKILMSALSRVDAYGTELHDFYLYIDEFQNVTTDSIAAILSEARKYRLSLNIAHQYIAQLQDTIRDAVFGNVGSLAAFRIGADDAEYLAKQFEPVFSAKDLINIDNRNAYIKILAHGKPIKPFNIETKAPSKGQQENIATLKELSYLKYGADRAQLEAQIRARYEK
jgi:hypothetical protein